MNFKILNGDDMTRENLDKIFELDKKVYGPIGEKAGEDFVGTIDNMVDRFTHNKRTFVCLLNKNNEIVGYINFLPLIDEVWNDIINGSKAEGNKEVIWDDNLSHNEVLSEYIKNTEENGHVIKHNNLFIISVVIDEKYRGREAVDELTKGWINYLNKLENEGYGINAIAGIAITADGEKFMRDRMFGIKRFIVPHEFRSTPDRFEREKNDSIEIVYLTEGDYLEYLLKHPDKLYRKTTKDDVYLFLPYEDSPNNHKLDDLLNSSERTTGEKVPDEIEPLLNNLDYCIKYEYKTNIADELKRVYLGCFRFLHTSDDYPKKDEQDNNEENKIHFIRGEELVHVSLLAHRATNMYVVMLCIPNCRYSSSQVEDQLFQGFIKIRPESHDNWKDMDEMGVPNYVDLNEYLSEQYGLYQCGDGKALICTSGIPEDTIAVNNPEELPVIEGRKLSQEFLNILTCETYQSLIQDFYVRNKTLVDMAANNRCVYDYYETYMSERMVAFILKDFSEDLTERMELAATYIFIVELVLFQNTALNKLNKNVSTALAYEGDVSYEYIDGLYRDYAKTIKFWNSNNFKYYGTQLEAEQIREAFDNEDLRNQYNEQQEFLEHMVDVKNARTQERNGMKINILGTIISVIGTQEFAIRILRRIYEFIVQDNDIAIEEATNTFDVTIIGGVTLFIVILSLLLRKRQQSGLLFRQPGNNKIKEPRKRKGFTFKKIATVLILFVMALGFSYLRPLHMSEGGDVTFLSTVVLFLIAYFFGGRVGIATALIYSLCKFGLDYEVGLLDKEHIIAELYDYILGYGVVGIGGFFSSIKNERGKHLSAFWTGYLISLMLRFIEGVYNCSYFYNETLWYSIQYCLGYIGIEAVITILILFIPKVREAIEYAKEIANS